MKYNRVYVHDTTSVEIWPVDRVLPAILLQKGSFAKQTFVFFFFFGLDVPRMYVVERLDEDLGLRSILLVGFEGLRGICGLGGLGVLMHF